MSATTTSSGSADPYSTDVERNEDGILVRVGDAPERPAPADRFRRQLHLVTSIRELWRSREMVRSVAERELRARYKQTYLGYAWALVTPFSFMILFGLFFRRVADIDTGGAPYALFAFVGLLVWGFFSTSVSLGGYALISAMPLLQKVYCPREVFSIGTVSVALVDAAISALALVVLLIVNTFMPHPETLWLPYLWAVQIAFTLGIVFVVSSVVVYFRDLKAIIPLALQLGLFATPVAYGLDKVPADARPLYVALNPMAMVIDASRRTMLLGQNPEWNQLIIASISAFVFLIVGYLIFKKIEGGMADVI